MIYLVHQTLYHICVNDALTRSLTRLKNNRSKAVVLKIYMFMNEYDKIEIENRKKREDAYRNF